MQRSDPPILIFSQDYELFFGRSGSIEQCLIEPCELLEAFCRDHGLSITYFVDAGMFVRMRELAAGNASLQRDYDRVRRHVESLASQGHEIGLHVHPHWEDTRWQDGGWEFSGTRYRLDQFPGDEAAEIVRRYASELQTLSREPLRSYRAGGFCVEPFAAIRDALLALDITVDSSIVPGAVLRDAEKGFDFSLAPDAPAWRFDDSPLVPGAGGSFIEVPITPQILPLWHYWERLFSRMGSRLHTRASAGGESKAIGREEVLRRLAGKSRVAELSADHAKAGNLSARRNDSRSRSVWHIMGHPKLLTGTSLQQLGTYLGMRSSWQFFTVGQFGAAIPAAGR